MAHGNYQQYCGWDEELFFDGHALEDYIFGICLNVLKYSQRLNCGGAHNFCAGCLRQYEEANIGRQRNCPACRHDYNFYAPNINLHANIGLLRVQLEGHKNRTCGHLPIQCEQGCGPRHPNIPHTAGGTAFPENLRNMVAERQQKVEQQERIVDERRRDTQEMQQQRDAAQNDAARYRYQRNWYREDFNRLQTEYEELDELHTDTARRLQRMEVLARQRQELITDLAGRLRRYKPYHMRSRSVVAPNIQPRSLFEQFNATSPQPGPATKF